MNANHLERARSIDIPTREAMLRRDPLVQQFWAEHRELLVAAWSQWESERTDSFAPNSTLLDERLRTAVSQAWGDPTSEEAVRELLHEAAPNVFEFQFFDPERLDDFRDYLDQVWSAHIPLRPPYGILLNRGGAMLDSRSEGHLAAPSFQAFYHELLGTYMRPISRLLFPEIMGFDTQTFGFSINYQPTTDSSIRPHTDASAVTLNININRPGEDFTGSTVDFFDRGRDEVRALTFEPGRAMIHRGDVPHMAQPITSGERTNLVLWLYGDRGQVPAFDVETTMTDPAMRWADSTVPSDNHAPF